MAHIAIVGAGVTGVTTADALLQRGHRVTVFDRHRYAAMETSFANAGQLSASNAEVWNSTATILKGLRWIWRRDAPLLVNPAPSWHKYSWIAEFAGHIRHYRANTIATTRMAIAARKQLFAIADREGIDFDLERRGILHICHDRASYDAAARVNILLHEGGLERVAVTPDEMRSIEPALSGIYYGGFFTPSDFTGDIHKFTRGLAAACIRAGATFIHEAEVGSIDPIDGGVRIGWTLSELDESPTQSFDAVAICAGTASRDFAAKLGDRINIYPVKGYSITVNLNSDDSRSAAPTVSLLDDSAKIATSRLGPDRFRVAGTAEFNGFNRDIRADRIKPLVDWTRRNFTGIDTSSVVPWSGLRPMMPNMMPAVRAGRRPGVFYNTGHGHLGWTLSAATAQTVADLVESAARDRRPASAGLHSPGKLGAILESRSKTGGTSSRKAG